jgi:hypothetical protein
LPGTIQAELPEVVVDGVPRWIVVREEAPGTAATEHVEDGVEDLAQAMEAGTPVALGSGKVELQAAPFGVG